MTQTVIVPDHYVVVGDVNRTIVDQLVDGLGVPVDLSVGGPTIRYMLWRMGDAAATVTAAGSIVTPTLGIVSYTFLSGDIDTAGLYIEEWQVTTGSNVVSYPEAGPHYVQIRPQIGS